LNFFVIVFLAIFMTPVAAMDMTIRGDTLVMSGAVVDSDHVRFMELSKTPQFAKVRIVVLQNSPGGRIWPVTEIAREIRKRRLSTLVDASRSFCYSACTGLFAAGVSRHYVNAAGIDPRIPQQRGLGFHEGSSVATGQRQYSGAGTAQMIDIYYEMGVSGAAKIVSNATFRGIYRIPGQRGLELGIATSLSPP